MLGGWREGPVQAAGQANFPDSHSGKAGLLPGGEKKTLGSGKEMRVSGLPRMGLLEVDVILTMQTRLRPQMS